jgi:hypothetical protein
MKDSLGAMAKKAKRYGSRILDEFTLSVGHA